MRTEEEFEKSKAFGKVAEDMIAEFFIQKGYSVYYAENYGVFDETIKYQGPVLEIQPPCNYTDMESIETSSEYVYAPDLLVYKDSRKKYIEIKRREKLGRFNGNDVFYIGEKYWNDYVELEMACRYWNHGADGVLFFVCIDDFHGEKNAIFYENVWTLNDKITYHDKRRRFYAFDLRDFVRY